MKFKFNIQKREIYTLNEKKGVDRRLKYNYSLSRLGGDTIAQKLGDMPRYGASMNKPILAFINLVLAKEGAAHHRAKDSEGNPLQIKRLTPDELDKLISYSGGSKWSNRVNRALSDLKYIKMKGWHPEYKKYINTKRNEIGVNKTQAAEVLKRFGLDKTLPGVHAAFRGNINKQTTEGYNQFMSLLTDIENNPEHEHWDEATEILNFVRKRQGGTPGKGLKNFLNKELAKAGYGKNVIKSMYGKGGKTKRALNYSLVINDKYVLSLYTGKSGDISLNKWRKNMHKLTLDVLKKNLKPEDFKKEYEAGAQLKPMVPLPWKVRRTMLPGYEADVPDPSRVTNLDLDYDDYDDFDDDDEVDLKSPEETPEETPEEIDWGPEEDFLQETKITIKDPSIEDLELAAEQGDEESAEILSSMPKEPLNEQATQLIKVDVALKYEKDFSFYGNVLNQIRSIKGIAIAKASDMGVIDIGSNKKMVILHLKFMPDRPLYQYLTYLQLELKKIKDKDGERVLATQMKGIPQKIEL